MGPDFRFRALKVDKIDFFTPKNTFLYYKTRFLAISRAGIELRRSGDHQSTQNFILRRIVTFVASFHENIFFTPKNTFLCCAINPVFRSYRAGIVLRSSKDHLPTQNLIPRRTVTFKTGFQ